MAPITQLEGFLANFSSGNANTCPCANRQATSSGISSCSAANGRRSRNCGKYEARVNHDFDEWVIAAICEYQAKTAQNNHQYVILNVATRESWKNDKGDSKPTPSGTASMPGGISRSPQDTPKGAANHPSRHHARRWVCRGRKGQKARTREARSDRPDAAMCRPEAEARLSECAAAIMPGSRGACVRPRWALAHSDGGVRADAIGAGD